MELFQSVLLVGILVLVAMGQMRSSEPKPSKRQMWVLDTSGIIDGRILSLTDSSFAPDTLVIPQFIVAELQQLADGRDSQKRERARYGLDVVKQLQDSPYTTVVIDKTTFDDIKEVDDKLVALAKKRGARLYTTDYNLNKVAVIERVQVINVNELAQNLRPTALPGETLTVKITQKGQGKGQGVGYLDDGTMIVVDNAAKLVGKKATVEVSRMHQTAAGKMMFATVKK